MLDRYSQCHFPYNRKIKISSPSSTDRKVAYTDKTVLLYDSDSGDGSTIEGIFGSPEGPSSMDASGRFLSDLFGRE